jgi:hypothetical protein
MKTRKVTLQFLFLSLTINFFTSCSESKAQDVNVVVETEIKSTVDSNNYNNFVLESGDKVKTRFNTPKGYVRVNTSQNSFSNYLQNLPLKPYGSRVKHFDGTYKENTFAYCAVVDLPFYNNRNHQCADAVMRLRAEYLFLQKKYNEIEFLFVSGKKSNYISYLNGRTPNFKNLWSYLEGVFLNASTLSLDRQLKSKDVVSLEIGDVFIKGGAPGHTVIVVDKCVDKDGNVKFMLAQSYMPAQDIQILVGDDGVSPWYDLNFGDYLYSAEWTFTKNQLKSF